LENKNFFIENLRKNILNNENKNLKNKNAKTREKNKNLLFEKEIISEENKTQIDLNSNPNKIMTNENISANNIVNPYNNFINANKIIKTATNENPTEILQSGMSYEDQIKISKQQETDGIFNNKNIISENSNIDHIYANINNDKGEFIPPSILRSNLEGKKSNNKFYENLQKRNNFNNNKNKSLFTNSFQNNYYKPLTDKISKNNIKNAQKYKFNRLKDIVFGANDEEYKQNLIKEYNHNIDNYSLTKSNNQTVYNNKPTTAPEIKITTSPLKNLINNQMEIYMMNQKI